MGGRIWMDMVSTHGGGVIHTYTYTYVVAGLEVKSNHLTNGMKRLISDIRSL